jgi:hypothetical protein
MAVYDTYKPFVIGNQFVPLVEESTVVDTGAEVGYRFTATEDFYSAVNGANWLRVVTNDPPPGVASRSEIVCRLYLHDPLEACTPLKKLIIPCTSGSGGSIGGGAATREAAVANPSDPTYVRLTGASQTARFWFGTEVASVAAALNAWNVEIVDVSVIYAISGPFADATTNTMSCGMERQVGPIKRYMDYLVTGPAASSSITALRRSRFGELCPFWDSGTDPNTEPMRGPWVYRGYDDIGLYALNPTLGVDNVVVFFETGSGAAGDFDIHYVGLQVTYRENPNLSGVGGMDLSGGAEISEGLYTYRCPLMPYDYPWAYTGGGGISTIVLLEGFSYTLTVSRAYSGSVSVSSPVPIPLSLINTIDQHVPELVGVQITKPTAEGAVPAYTETTEYPAIVAYSASPTLWATQMIPAKVNPACHAYEQQMPQAVHDAGYYYSEQQVPNDTAGTFVWATFYARAAESVTGGLYISQTDGAGNFLGPEGLIDYATWLALPEIVDGWRKVTVALSPGAVLTGAGGVTYWQFWSSSADLMVWEVLGATANHTETATGTSSGAVAGYHGETAIANFQGVANYPLDMTLTLAQEMSGAALAVVQETQVLTAVDEYCGVPVSTIPTGIVYNHLTWDIVLSAMVSGWGFYEIQRRDTTMDTDVWETIAKITNPYVGDMDDYEARIGVQSSYRIRTVHTTGILGPWSAEITSTIAAPGVTGTGVGVGLLVFTSNEDPTANLAYVHIHGGDQEESFDFVEAGQGSLEPVYGRDYQVALRPVERGGVAFTRTILVNKVGIPPGTLDRGFTGLRDLAWDAIPYVCVRDELANRWLANIAVPSGSIRRQDGRATHYQVSAVTITEVVGAPYAHDDPVPFLGLTSTQNVGRYAEIASCSPLATLVDVDIRVKFIAMQGGVGWGFRVERHAVGPPESWWGFGSSNSDGPETYFDVLGDDGSFYDDVETIVPVIGQPLWARCVYDHDDGVGTSTATFYSSLDGVAWTSHGTAVGGPAGLVPTGDPSFYISVNESTVVQEMIVIDAATSTTIMSPDFAAQTATTTSFVDVQANTWNILVW